MKVLSIFLLVLLAGTIISGIPVKSYADPQLDTLLNIATQARNSLGITISQINNIPDQINQLYKQGSDETDELAQAANQQDVDSAKQHFLAAMKYFEETNDQINSLNATAPNDQQKTEMIQLRSEIIRLENMGKLLKTIVLQNDVDINFTSFDGMLQNATQDLSSGNLDDASTQIQNANDFVVTTHNSLTKVAQERILGKEKEFTEKQIARLSIAQENTVSQPTPPENNTVPTPPSPPVNATSTPPENNTVSTPPPSPPVNATSTPPTNATSQPNANQNTMPVNPSYVAPAVNNSDITTMEHNTKDMVAELKRLIAEGKVDQAINLIKTIRAYQKLQLTEKASAISSTVNTTSTPSSIPSSPPVNATTPTSQFTTQENHTISDQSMGHDEHLKKHDENTKPEKRHHH